MKTLLDGSSQEPEHAQLINNYGYEYLLERRFAEAEPYFERARVQMTKLGRASEILNVRANLLTCQLGQASPSRWEERLSELKDLNRQLCRDRDWRARKTLILLARHAEMKGNRRSAISFARRAVRAAADMPTQHRLEDAEYLSRLAGKVDSEA